MTLPLAAPPPPRSPWQLFYGGVLALRRRFAARRARRLPRPVISIGNLRFGGSGKTPLTAAVAGHLRDGGLRVAILSRGYRSRSAGVRVVSVGEGPLLGPRLAGDEPVLLAGELPGVAVVVAPDRWRAGRHALDRLSPAPDVFVLDDGFSHLRLARDLDLLAFPAEDPFAGGRLLPSGRLREPLRAAAHADAVLLTGAGGEGGGANLARALRPYGFAGPGFSSATEAAAPQPLAGSGARAPAAGARVLAVSAIARPAAFLDTVRRAGLTIAEHLVYRDHHDYPAATLEAIARAFQACGAEAVVTTGKDRVKLQGRLELPLLEIPIRARPEAAFLRWLDERMATLTARRPA